jgi:hypothetical protein
MMAILPFSVFSFIMIFGYMSGARSAVKAD